jgi:MOSC domain-containing protein YiiM
MAKIISINTSAEKGRKKKPVADAVFIENSGIENDAHAGTETHRQVSLLGIESVEKMKKLGIEVGAGDFAENLTTEGIDLLSLTPGDRLKCGGGVVLEITQLGKECHSRCEIFKQVGDCVMPREGIFAKVISGGRLRAGDEVSIVGIV